MTDDALVCVPWLISPTMIGVLVLARRQSGDDDAGLSGFAEAARLAARLASARSSPGDALLSAGATVLTGRERVVLGLLCEGLTAHAIGHRLSCSPRTVSKHLEHIYFKLEVHDRVSAVRAAETRGLIPLPMVAGV